MNYTNDPNAAMRGREGRRTHLSFLPAFPVRMTRCDYILTLSKGSRSQLISERFSRMISARRSMSA